MRLFVALRPPAAVLNEIDAVVAPYRSEWSRLRWVASDRWHVTLCFLGEVSDEVLPSLEAELDAPAKAHPALHLSFAGAGAFPRVHRARVLWIGMDGDRRELTELAGSVSSAAGSAGLEPTRGQRRFSPHLTLARCREPTDLAPLVDALEGFAGTGWTAGEVHLVRSHLGPKPRYETVHSWSLNAGLPHR